MLLWDFLTRVMQGVTMAFFEDVWTRNFLNVFATPMRTSEYLTGLILVAVCTSLMSLVVMVVFARAAFGLSFLTYGAALAPFLAVLFLTGIAFGVAAAAIVLRLGPASEWLDLADPDDRLAFRRRLLSGDGPARMDAGDRELSCRRPMCSKACARSSPASPRRGTGSRSAAASRSSISSLACLFFMAVYRIAIRTGLIARYSAETVS